MGIGRRAALFIAKKSRSNTVAGVAVALGLIKLITEVVVGVCYMVSSKKEK